jgi:heat shock protein HslJ
VGALSSVVPGRRAWTSVAVIVVAALSVTGCTKPPPPGPGGPPSLAGTSWVLVADSLSVPLPRDRTITLAFGEGRLSGSSACNSYFATVAYGPGNRLRVSSIGSTKMACDEPVMAAERAYLGKLAAVTSYRVDNAGLSLSGAPGGPLRFRRAGNGPAPAAPAGQWIVTGFVDGRTQAFVQPVVGATITLVLGADGKLTGRACNQYGGTWSVAGDRITIGGIYSTDMYCATPEGAMDQEIQYLATLDDATRWQVEGDTLILASGEGRGRPLVTAEPDRKMFPTG